ncbi:exosortase F system-associated protein [Mesonia ostreae]|uniref:Exosortase F system-associated protein n=1 Tax=Mesonia ostreae TaxID=861110 RepID=A0ABU2KH15_9FLAO|nr:exosortase F system-associated protein [Mesonia ostreae]MDT0293991.1 exosortase F system-associated protein [Mesonia ostreae]
MKIIKWILGIGCVLLLVSIRLFEDVLFHDPLVGFYKSNFNEMDPPHFDTWKLIGFTSLRFFMNTTLSLLILFLAFSKKSILKFSALFYGLAFVVLISVFFVLLSPLETKNYMFLFYVRRFLIQPVFLLLLLPAFYYQQSIKKTDS